MISLVLVSHSAVLAQGVKELVENATGGRVPVAAAGGSGDSEHPIGTDSFQVLEAIQSVLSPDGIILLADLGSAVLSAETALEFLEEHQRGLVHLSPAALVEGAIAAASRILGGGSLEESLDEARSALEPKKRHLSTPAAQVSLPAPPLQISILLGKETCDQPQELIQDVSIPNPFGLHARPAVLIIQRSAEFNARIVIENLSRSAPLASTASLNGLLLLEGRQGDTLRLRASGVDGERALAALMDLIADGFGELTIPDNAATIGRSTVIDQPGEMGKGRRAQPASPGVALAELVHFKRPPHVSPENQPGEGSLVERQKLALAIAAATLEIRGLEAWAASRLDPNQAGIFTAQRLLLEDADLLEDVYRGIDHNGQSAAFAWSEAVKTTSERLQALENEFLRARAADVLDAAERVQAHLGGETHWMPVFNRPVVLAAKDLLPSQVSALDPAFVQGLLLAAGSPTAHSLILARGLGIPAVVMAGTEIFSQPAGSLLGLDGSTGEVWLQPEENLRKEILTRREAWQAERQRAYQLRCQPACTRSGQSITILANINRFDEALLAIENGADGIGLLRTELMFQGRVQPPGEEEQFLLYQSIAEVMGNRPLVIRVLDAGGDKPLPFLQANPEENPFLGIRGTRLLLAHPELFKTQLRAILRASHEKNIQVMLPMIAQNQEIFSARRLLEEAKAELDQAGFPYNQHLPLGIMIETPAAALMAEDLAKVSDFFSIGSNDLAQYVMAADRTLASVSALADAFQPAVLRTIYQVIQAANYTATPVSLCGELAGDPLAAPLLAGMGLREFSMRPSAIPEVKLTLSRVDLSEVNQQIPAILQMDSADAVREACKMLQISQRS